MSHSNPVHRLVLSLLIVLSTFSLNASAAAPLDRISNPLTLNLINNSSLGTNPPVKIVVLDATHSIYFTQYQRYTPERNYFAAIIAMQTSLMVEYFGRRVEKLEPGAVGLDVFGTKIYVTNPTGLLTYALAHGMLGELGEFLIKENVCTAKFELWEIHRTSIRHVSVGWLAPRYMTNSVA